MTKLQPFKSTSETTSKTGHFRRPRCSGELSKHHFLYYQACCGSIQTMDNAFKQTSEFIFPKHIYIMYINTTKTSPQQQQYAQGTKAHVQ